ncbi:MAG: hypothetical protein IKH75_11025 [Ruminococcus sp.]|nr:hypothetical protein [Ruminococcus sp.]
MVDTINALISAEEAFIGHFDDLVIGGNNRGCVDGKIIGTGRVDYTRDLTMYDMSINGKPFSMIDVPGIEGDERKFEKIIRKSIDKAHLVFYVNGSGKKIEKGTLEKIKKYMHDGTSVYAVFNVHCKPKKSRIIDIDGTYAAELGKAYIQSIEIINQTEAELKTILGHNYKGSISMNGLLAFCSLAFNSNGLSTIVYDRDKLLRSDQQKYLNEYDLDRKCMFEDSNIDEIQKKIEGMISGFSSHIYQENIKKLKNRLSEMIERVKSLKISEDNKIQGFKSIYDEFERNCNFAKEDYIHSLDQIGYNAATDAFSEVKNELFRKIEDQRGRTKPQEIQAYFDNNKERIIENLKNSLNRRMEQLQKEYEERLSDALNRLIKDFDKTHTLFKISLSAANLSIDDSFAKELKYNLKSFGSDAFRVVSLGVSGFFLGSAIPVIGNILGAIIGALAGVILSIWNFFAKEADRVNRAKTKLQSAIDEQIDNVDQEIRKQLDELKYEDKINESYEQICNNINKQKVMLDKANSILTKVESQLVVFRAKLY